MAILSRTSMKMTKASSNSSLACTILNLRHRFSSSSSSSSSSSIFDHLLSTNRKTKKNSQNDRLSAVIDAANDRKLPPELRGQRSAISSETDIINIVEQRIWQSMEEGQFEKLPGKGKPLNLSTNPHADPDEDTLYRILSKNGCAPEWVELNKQIRSETTEWRSALKKAWAYKISGDDVKWTECSEALKVQLGAINNKMCGIKWERELDRLNEK